MSRNRDDDRWVPGFPNVTYVYGEWEREYFALPAGEPRRMVLEDSVLPLMDAGIVQEMSDEGALMCDGIPFLPTPGPSLGPLAISITSQRKTALFSGDVMHSTMQVYQPE